MPQAMPADAWRSSRCAADVVLPLGAAMARSRVAGGGARPAAGTSRWKPLAPEFDKLDPLAGLARMFSKQQLVDTLKACVLALVLGAIGALVSARAPGAIHARCIAHAAAGGVGARRAASCCGRVLLLLLALALFALVDVPLQRHLLDAAAEDEPSKKRSRNTRRSRATPRSRPRSSARMREMANRRMLAAVPQGRPGGDEPDPLRGRAEVRRGHDGRAARRRQGRRPAGAAASATPRKDAKVPVLQAPPLARALYAHAEIDREIPAALFAAVAQVLACVYQLRAALSGKAPMPQAVPEPQVPPGLDPHEAARRRRPLNERPAAEPMARRPRRHGEGADRAALRRHDAGDDGAAAAAVRARPAVHLQHRDRADGDDGVGVHGQAARLRGASRRCC